MENSTIEDKKHLPKTDKTYHRNICKTPKTTEEMLKNNNKINLIEDFYDLKKMKTKSYKTCKDLRGDFIKNSSPMEIHHSLQTE